MAVLIVGTLDTKGLEVGFARDHLLKLGLDVIVADAGVLGPPQLEADIARETVFSGAGLDLDSLRQEADRGKCVTAAGDAVAKLAARLYSEGKIEGVLGMGGSAGTVIGTAAMRALPFGVPKVMLSTLASGQTRPYVGGSDVALFHSVADIAGLNRVTRTVILNAANALAGMVRERRRTDHDLDSTDRPVITATMFGVTTPCVDQARLALDAMGYEVIVFHATGIGGLAMEGLIRDGQVNAVLDLTTTELADEVVGGVLSAGPDRLRAAGRAGIPQVVSVGAVDMVNFGPMATVPDAFRHRKLHVHNPSVTLMRTTPDENRAIARVLASALSEATGPTALLLPLGGVSALDAPGKSFYDPVADEALFTALREELRDRVNISFIESRHHINDPEFADLAVRTLGHLVSFSNLR